ncbi:MATE family efflux transporter [soil metagenome]
MTPSISAKLVVFSAWASRLCSAFIMIYSLRVLSSNLSANEYATYIIIIGLSGWYALSDMGIGYAVQNTITRKAALGQPPDPDIISAYMLAAACALLIISLLYTFHDSLAAELFSKLPQGGLHYSHVFLLTSIMLVVGAAVGISNKILYGVHLGYVANIASAVSSLAGFGILQFGIAGAENKIVYAVAAMYGPVVFISTLLATIQISRSLKSGLLPNRKGTIELVRSARSFSLFNLLAAAVLQIDYVIMSQKINSLDIVQYYNLAKIFAFVAFFNQAIMFAAWPHFTQQFATGQTAPITKSVHRLIKIGAVITVVTTATLMLLSDRLSAFLTPGMSVEFRYSVIAGFGVLALARCITDPFAIFLQSIGNLRPLIIFALVQAVIGALLQWELSELMGIEGILVAITLSFLLTVAWGLPYSARKRLSNPPRLNPAA